MFKTTISMWAVLWALMSLTPANATGPEATGRIETDGAPVSMAYDGKTGRLFLATDDGNIMVLDGKSGKIIETVKPKKPIATYMGGNGISLNPATGRLYVPVDEKGVIIFDIKSNKAIKTVGEKNERGGNAMAVAVNQKDNSYVMVEWSGYVSIYDGNKDVLKDRFALDYKGRSYFALSPDGESLYIIHGYTLFMMSMKEKRVNKTFDLKTAQAAPLVDPATGNVFLGGRGVLHRVDKKGGISTVALKSAVPLGAMLAINPKTGNLFVPLEDGTVAVVKAGVGRMEIVATIEAGPSPKAIVVDVDTGRVYVARAGGVTVIQDRGE